MDDVPSAGLPSMELLTQTQTDPQKVSLTEGNAAHQVRENFSGSGGKDRKEPQRFPRAPVLLGLERQYCHPQAPSWGDNNIGFFL